MKVTDLVISPKSVGQHLILTSVRPAYEYANGSRTDSISGYRYDIVMPDRAYEKLTVKIEGEPQINLDEGESIEVIFEGLELFIYWLNGMYNVGARATGIKASKQKAT